MKGIDLGLDKILLLASYYKPRSGKNVSVTVTVTVEVKVKVGCRK